MLPAKFVMTALPFVKIVMSETGSMARVTKSALNAHSKRKRTINAAVIPERNRLKYPAAQVMTNTVPINKHASNNTYSAFEKKKRFFDTGIVHKYFIVSLL